MKDFQKENSLPQGVSSMNNMLNICMDTIKARFASERKTNELLRFLFPFEYEEYKLLLAQSANVILEKRRENHSFILDDKNEPVVRQFFYA
ncbi:hypothetical protein EZS27_035879 [termite gut metagenome]|uniref:Uncharacterized protein n=1 Tax=termite gut metagenome TaxID=433724 RepID=A0A5J4PW46_9ZZZZ